MTAAPQPRVVGIGELLWDLLPAGARMGGAPANFACHCQALGASASVVSRVGDDDAGRTLVGNLRGLGLGVAGIQLDPDFQTGAVEVRIGDDGQPDFTILHEVAWDHLQPDHQSLAMMLDADAVCFGTLGQRSEASGAAIRQLVSATRPGAFRIFDVNLRQSYFNAGLIHQSLEIANVCKLSDGELPVVCRLLGIEGNPAAQMARLMEIYQLRMLVYTRGKDGSILSDGVSRCGHPGYPAKVRDTIGAGDSFTAAVAMGLLQGWPVDVISEVANAVASHVCSCDGAIPPLPEKLRSQFSWSHPVEAAGQSPDVTAMAM